MRRLARFVTRVRRKNAPRTPFQPKLLLFDFDGTIADTLGDALEILNILSGEFGFRRLDPEELQKARDMRTRELMAYLGVSATKLPGISRRGNEEMIKRIGHVMPLPGVPEVLAILRGHGVRLGIVTSNSEANVRNFLTRHDLDYFEMVLSSSKLLGKAREIRIAIKKSGLPKDQILFVGDESRDIEAAQKAGIPIAAVTWGYNSVKALEAMKPEYVIEKASELLGIVGIPSVGETSDEAGSETP